jgi:hypothetical protein
MESVYYAVNDNPKYLFCVARSVQSLRSHNSSIPVFVFMFGSPAAATVRKLARLDVAVVVRPAVNARRLTFLKWYALRSLDSERLLFVDADTVFFSNPFRLFRALDRLDFYAREEVGTIRHRSYPHLIGTLPVPMQLDVAAFAALCRRQGVRQLPIFNSGVMLFNHGTHHRVAGRVERFESLRKAFQTGRLGYPCSNRCIVEEIVAAMVLGSLPSLRCGVIPPALSPWYIEHRAGDVHRPGVVMHVWMEYYPFYLDEFEGKRRRAQFHALGDR